MTTLHAVANWIYHVLGFKGTGPWYGSWSGWVGDLVFIGGGATLYRKHTCHKAWCLRPSRHPAAGGLYQLCAKHHPDVPTGGATLAEMHAAHAATKRDDA